MSDNDLIRRGDALKTADEELRRYGFSAPEGRRYDMRDAIAALPAVTPAPDAQVIREAALREAAQIATDRWAARREHADHLAELDHPEAMIEAKTVSAKAYEAQAIADQILALIQKGGA